MKKTEKSNQENRPLGLEESEREKEMKKDKKTNQENRPLGFSQTVLNISVE